MEGGSKRGKLKGAAQTPDAGLIDEALHEDEHVVTDSGFKKISEISKGDIIYDSAGKTTIVLDKIDVGVKQLYAIELRNGVSIEACENHLWEVRDKFTNKTEIKTKNLHTHRGRISIETNYIGIEVAVWLAQLFSCNCNWTAA